MKTLLCLLEHPTQYDPPLWAAMQRRGRLRPVVRYARPGAPADQEAGAAVSWERAEVGAPLRPGEDLGRLIDGLPERPDACLVPGWTRPLAWRATRACRSRGIPVILPSDKTIHEPERPGHLARGLVHAMRSRLFQGFLTTGRLGWAALRSLGIPDSRIATGLYPVDVAWWSGQRREAAERSGELRRGLGGDLTVLAVSKWSEREDPLTVVRAFGVLQASRPGARLLLVGDGPLRGAVERELGALGLREKALLMGYVPYRTLAACYGAADLFIHVPLSEPWGISVGEALACGLPVVASTTVGAAADLVIHGQTGALVPPRSPADAGRGLLDAARLLADPRAARSVAAAAARVDVEAASLAIEALVDRLPDAEPFEPLLGVLDSGIRNHWGRWPA